MLSSDVETRSWMGRAGESMILVEEMRFMGVVSK